MKIFVFTAVLAVGLLSSSIAQSEQTPAPATQQTEKSGTVQPKIDPVKEADIRQLLDVLGTTKIMRSTMDSMVTSIKPVLAHSLPPGDYRDKLVDLFFDKFKAKADPKEMISLAVPLYDKHFSDQEIKDLIKFYQTPLGQKAVSALPQLATELHDAGQQWGERLGRECMQEVLQEHPDMADALQQASKAQGR